MALTEEYDILLKPRLKIGSDDTELKQDIDKLANRIELGIKVALNDKGLKTDLSSAIKTVQDSAKSNPIKLATQIDFESGKQQIQTGFKQIQSIVNQNPIKAKVETDKLETNEQLIKAEIADTRELIEVKKQLATVLREVESHCQKVSEAYDKKIDSEPMQGDDESDRKFESRLGKWEESLENLSDKKERITEIRDLIKDTLESPIGENTADSFEEARTELEDYAMTYSTLSKAVGEFESVNLDVFRNIAEAQQKAQEQITQNNNPADQYIPNFEENTAAIHAEIKATEDLAVARRELNAVEATEDVSAPETEAMTKTNSVTEEHIKLMEDAARAELEKLEISKKVAEALIAEGKAFKDSGEKAEEAEKKKSQRSSKKSDSDSTAKSNLIPNEVSVAKITQKIEDLKTKMELMKGTWSKILGDPETMREVKNIISQLGEINPHDSNAADKVAELNRNYTVLSRSIKIAGDNQKNFFDRVGETFTRLSSYLVNVALIGTVTSALRNALNDLKAIDTQLTQLSKVTDLTREGFKQASIEALDAANKWGRTASDYLSAQEAFAKSGISNYKEFADLSTMVQSAGDLSAELANDYIKATNAGFQLGYSVEKLTEVLDAQNQVTNKNSVSMNDMAVATKNYANTANVVGESVQTMTALIATGIGATEKAPEEVSKALRTLSLNIAQVKGEVDGEIVDEESMACKHRSFNVNPEAQGCAA